MAKGQTAVQPVRTARPKSAAQLEQKQRNIELHARRLAALQETQKLAKKLRAEGYVGTDHDIVAKWKDDQEVSKAARFVKIALDSTVGRLLYRWLNGRQTLNPIHVQNLINGFLQRERNVDIADAVGKAMAEAESDRQIIEADALKNAA